MKNCGFQRRRGCSHQLFSLRLLMESSREYRHPLYVCFIDMNKAYDSVNHDSLWRILQHRIRILHVDSFAAVKAYGQTSVRFPVTSGVRQDCVLATTLFNNASIHMALDHHRQASRGIQEAYLLDGELVGNRRALRLETLITDLEYADDMALLADTWSDITIMLESLSSCCKMLGLTISCKNTKSLAVLPQGRPDITTSTHPPCSRSGTCRSGIQIYVHIHTHTQITMEHDCITLLSYMGYM